MEHRDGSAARTIVNHTETGPGSREANDGKVDHLDHEYHERFDRIDYIFPEGNPRDTDPGNEKGVDEDLRIAQMQLRKAEIQEVTYIMSMIHGGNGQKVAEANLRQEGFAGASTRGLRGINWENWKSRFHLEQVTMLGHSFGAATAVEVLRDKQSFPNVSQGILYDIWGAPVQLNQESQITGPLLAINSEAFMYWNKNMSSVTSVVEEARSNGALCWLLTVQGTIHLSQSDFHLLYPRTCHHLLRATVEPKRAITININASLEFLKLVMPERISKMNRGDDEGILSITALEELPSERKPDDKWIGMRLKAPPDLLKRMPRKKQTVGVDKEVWMHIAPTNEELRLNGMERTGGKGEAGFRRVEQPEKPQVDGRV
jgi:platelet-activating factor acetylhydrolase